MRISDWSSDVCSSDLRLGIPGHRARVGEVARLGIDQRRGEQMFGERRVALKEDGIMMLAAERAAGEADELRIVAGDFPARRRHRLVDRDRKSTRLNSSH